MDSQNALTSYFRKCIFNFDKNNIHNLLIGNVYFEQCVSKINDYISIIPSHPSWMNLTMRIWKTRKIY